MNYRYKVICYEGSSEERVLELIVGKNSELFPGMKRSSNGVDVDESKYYGYQINVLSGNVNGSSLASNSLDPLKIIAAGLLRLASYGNGSFPLDNHYLRG